MNVALILAIAGGALIIFSLVLIFVLKKRSKRMNTAYYGQKWHELQALCASRKTWPEAIIRADDLLCEALKQAGYKGRTTGEKLVAAQHELSSNDTVWAGHKLRNKIAEMDVRKLKKQDILLGLQGFRQALRDLGALDG